MHIIIYAAILAMHLPFSYRWVALESVCTQCVEQVKPTQRELHGYLRENPTIQQSRLNVKGLALQFEERLARTQQQITNESENTRALRMALEAAPIQESAD